MKKGSISLTLAALTFLVGTAAVCAVQLIRSVDYVAAPEVEQKQSESVIGNDVAIELDPCELMYGVRDLEGKKVSIRVTAYVMPKPTSEFILHVPNGVGCHYNEAHRVDLPPILNVPSSGFLTNLRDKLQRGRLEVDLQVVGEAKGILLDGKYPTYLITPLSVELISRPRKFFPKGAA